MTASVAKKSTRLRPYWHIDAKWICSILLAISMALTLTVISAYRLTTRASSTTIITYAMAGLTSPDGIDSTNGVQDIKQLVDRLGSYTVKIAGIPITLTNHDVDSLSPRDLRLKVFGTFASTSYDQGAHDFAASQGLDQAVINQFSNQASLLNAISLKGHQRIAKLLTPLIIVDMILIGLVILFSYRFGKLVSVGVVLLFAALPAVPLSILAGQYTHVIGTASTENISNLASATSSFASYVAPLIIPTVTSTYRIIFIAGIMLLAVAAVGRIIYSLTHRSPDDAAKKAFLRE